MSSSSIASLPIHPILVTRIYQPTKTGKPRHFSFIPNEFHTHQVLSSLWIVVLLQLYLYVSMYQHFSKIIKKYTVATKKTDLKSNWISCKRVCCVHDSSTSYKGSEIKSTFCNFLIIKVVIQLHIYMYYQALANAWNMYVIRFIHRKLS